MIYTIHGGIVLESILNYIDKYTTQLFIAQMGVMLIVLAIFMWVYLYNRKKYHNLKHQIPASVVKNYLDSIIQNSTALKSSLFRGGGLDIDPSSVPSVMPLNQLQSAPMSISLGEGGDEALRAEVARLQSQLAEKNNIIKDLEAKNIDLSGTVKARDERIIELEKLLAEAQANVGTGEAAGDSSELLAQLDEITKERDQLKSDLSQYDIIEDDLADLKRLKQENEQLKSALESGGGADIPTPAAEPEPVVAAEPISEPEVEAPEEVVAQAPEEAPEAAPEAAAKDDKSPEDLLSEFEKMLG